MNRREKELEDTMTFVDGVSAFGLPATDDPVSAFFRFGERVQTPCCNKKVIGVEDDLDAHVRVAFAPMDDLCAKFILENEEVCV